MTAHDLLDEVEQLGIRIAANGDRLRIIAPPGTLTDDLRQRLAAHKSALLELLSLEQRVRAMAERWQFLPGELEDFLAAARADPAAWLRAVALDERREAEFRAGGLRPPRADG